MTNYDLLTPKMKMLQMDVVGMLGNLPEERRRFLFGNPGYDEDMTWVLIVANYIVLEFIKYSFDKDDPVYSIRHFIKDGDDSERMTQSRTAKYVLKHKRREEIVKGYVPESDYKFADTGMDTIEKRLKGRTLTEMNFFEHQNIHDLEIIKALVERRIVSAKKIPNDRFCEMFEQYDNLVESLIERSKKSDYDMVFASLALFTLEWHYPIELLFFLSCMMEEEDLTEVELEKLALLVGCCSIESRFGGCYTLESRMVKERIFVSPTLFGKYVDEESRIGMFELMKETIVLGVVFKECVFDDKGEPYKEWFRKESSMEDWASFFRYYDLFGIWQRKEWTGKRIRYMRKLFDMVLLPKI